MKELARSSVVLTVRSSRRQTGTQPAPSTAQSFRHCEGDKIRQPTVKDQTGREPLTRWVRGTGTTPADVEGSGDPPATDGPRQRHCQGVIDHAMSASALDQSEEGSTGTHAVTT